MNGRHCSLCQAPLPERTDRNYSMRTDCGNHSIGDMTAQGLLDVFYKPLITYSRAATEEQTGTNAWCELNAQKVCADSLYNKDFLYQAKAVDYPKEMVYDPMYCHYNGWLAPEIRKLQHDFE